MSLIFFISFPILQGTSYSPSIIFFRISESFSIMRGYIYIWTQWFSTSTIAFGSASIFVECPIVSAFGKHQISSIIPHTNSIRTWSWIPSTSTIRVLFESAMIRHLPLYSFGNNHWLVSFTILNHIRPTEWYVMHPVMSIYCQVMQSFVYLM